MNEKIVKEIGNIIHIRRNGRGQKLTAKEKHKPLRENKDFVDEWNIKDKKDVHPSHRTRIFQDSAVKDAVEGLKEEVLTTRKWDNIHPDIKVQMSNDFLQFIKKWLEEG